MSAEKEREDAFIADHAPSSMEDLHLARGRAIHQYVHLEKVSLSSFSFAVGARGPDGVHSRREKIVQHAYAQVLRNSHFHRSLMREIGKVYLPEHQQSFVRTLMKEFQYLSELRNRIAHFEIEGVRGADGKQRYCIRAGGGRLIDTAMFVEELDEFVRRCRFSFYAMNAFACAVRETAPDWLTPEDFERVLSEPFEVPPAEGSPLFQFWK